MFGRLLGGEQQHQPLQQLLPPQQYDEMADGGDLALEAEEGGVDEAQQLHRQGVLGLEGVDDGVGGSVVVDQVPDLQNCRLGGLDGGVFEDLRFAEVVPLEILRPSLVVEVVDVMGLNLGGDDGDLPFRTLGNEPRGAIAVDGDSVDLQVGEGAQQLRVFREALHIRVVDGEAVPFGGEADELSAGGGIPELPVEEGEDETLFWEGGEKFVFEEGKVHLDEAEVISDDVFDAEDVDDAADDRGGDDAVFAQGREGAGVAVEDLVAQDLPGFGEDGLAGKVGHIHASTHGWCWSMIPKLRIGTGTARHRL